MKTYHNKTISDTLKELKTSRGGLTTQEAQDRLKKFGQNTLKLEKKQNYVLKFLSQFKDIMVIILLCAAVVSLIFAIVEKSSTELIDAIIIFVIVLINATLSFTQELKAENALESLKKMSQPFSTILRDGEQKRIKTSDIVVGDIIFLEAGDVVPADILLIESASLKCDESTLTGESVSSDKEAGLVLKEKTSLADRKNMCFSSTTISYGRGIGVVVSTGQDAEIGKIASLITQEKNESTPLQKSLNKLGEIITFIVLAIAIIIFLVDVIFAHFGYVESFLTAVAIAVAAIPESLPAVVTIILSLGVIRLAKKNAIIKKLHAVETLGCCGVICSDKTGTITQNKMTVQEISVNLSIKSSNLDLTNSTEQELLRCMLLCNDARKQSNTYLGDPTESALIRYAEKQNLLKNDFEIKFKRVGEVPFDSKRKLMTTINIVDHNYIQYTKGAVDELLLKCTHILVNGRPVLLTQNHISKIKEQNTYMCSNALRVLAYAAKNLGEVTSSNKFNSKIEEDNLIFLGLSGMIDPPRKEVFNALKKCKTAGMKTVMITGDHMDTATAIAKSIGMIKSDKEVINGSFLDKFSDKELEKEILKYSVFTRVTPEHKVRIVKALKSTGKIVAMTGDGVNDAPSIKVADIGIGMGQNGTEVTKEVADMILSDDNFATIVVAVEEGRRIFGNIKKTIEFLLSCNIAEVLAIFALTLIFPQYAFLSAVQILFINLVTDTFPSIALGVDEAQKDIMTLPPRDPKKNILSGRAGINIIYQGITQAIIVILNFVIGIYVFNSQSIASTMAFLTLNFIQLFHMYNVHSEKGVFRDNAFKNKFINISFICEISLFILISFIPPLANILGMAKLSLLQWAIVFVSSFLIIPVCEIVKYFQQKRLKKKV